MLEQGIIVPSHSPWESSVVVVPKADGSLRICIDFRCLNAIGKFDAFHCVILRNCWSGYGSLDILPP